MMAHPGGMMQSAKFRLPKVERSQGLVQLGARRKFEMQRLIRLTFPVGSECLK